MTPLTLTEIFEFALSLTKKIPIIPKFLEKPIIKKVGLAQYQQFLFFFTAAIPIELVEQQLMPNFVGSFVEVRILSP